MAVRRSSRAQTYEVRVPAVDFWWEPASVSWAGIRPVGGEDPARRDDRRVGIPPSIPSTIEGLQSVESAQSGQRIHHHRRCDRCEKQRLRDWRSRPKQQTLPRPQPEGPLAANSPRNRRLKAGPIAGGTERSSSGVRSPEGDLLWRSHRAASHNGLPATPTYIEVTIEDSANSPPAQNFPVTPTMQPRKRG